ncbi:hypothetical protein RchiOBHm_Chr6g0261871 [Rosa chinensis]|uniref:Uncharacterized protein n=1 Tax=Rosa chinensis TaxID=74649 RepID=A0A2P6PNG5_ROSCH|nr:hypothetical protein RchiOBHm_Chr6g0261871 [Rosa chinensis]
MSISLPPTSKSSSMSCTRDSIPTGNFATFKGVCFITCAEISLMILSINLDSYSCLSC